MNRRRLLALLGTSAVFLGGYLLIRVFQRYDPGEVAEAVRAVPAADLALALVLTMASFACISAIEYLSMRHVRCAVPWRRVALTAVSAIGIGHAVGVAALSSGAIRCRMYGRARVGLAATGKIVVFCAFAAGSGFAGIGGLALMWQAEELARLLDIPAGALRLAAAGALLLLGGYFAICFGFAHRRIRVWRDETIVVPTLRFALAQFAAAGLNILCIGGVLYAALRSTAEAHYLTATVLYVGGDVAALIGHVPGGWGVLEFIVTGIFDDPRVLGGIVLYRAVYYLMPLGVGLAAYLMDEVAGRRRAGARRRAERIEETN